jgi:RimJ/RimL family protein N-acetyltransferase
MHGVETMRPIETVELVKPLPNSWDGDATWRSKFLDALGLRTVRFKPVLVDAELRLRICRWWDLARLKTRFDPELLGQAAGREVRPFRSLLSFRKWLKSTFDLCYLIEIQENGQRRIIGFEGFYGVRPKEHVWMSLAIFDADDRRCGYGSRTVELVCAFLQHETGIKRIFVEVAKRNQASLSFFQACSFRPKGDPAGSLE